MESLPTLSSLNFQQNSRYARTLSNISYGLQFNEKLYIKHYIVPLEINLIKADLSTDFSAQLQGASNSFLKNSFLSHVTTVSRYTYIFNNQKNQEKDQYKTFVYFKMNLESGGNIVRGIYNLTEEKKDSLGAYHFLYVPLAQFVRTDMDFRAYRSVRKLGRFVFRAWLFRQTTCSSRRPSSDRGTLRRERSRSCPGAPGVPRRPDESWRPSAVA